MNKSLTAQEKDAELSEAELEASEKPSAKVSSLLTLLLPGDSVGYVEDIGLSLGASTCNRNGDEGEADASTGYATDSEFVNSFDFMAALEFSS